MSTIENTIKRRYEKNAPSIPNGKKVYIPLVGTVENYLERSPLNFYSWSHIDFGMFVFLLFSLIISIPEALSGAALIDWWLIMVLVFVSGIIWEIMEIILLHRWGWRDLNKRKMFFHALFDLFFIIFGGLIMWFSKWVIIDLFMLRGSLFYIMGLGLCLIVLITYLIGFSVTDKTIKIMKK